MGKLWYRATEKYCSAFAMEMVPLITASVNLEDIAPVNLYDQNQIGEEWLFDLNIQSQRPLTEAKAGIQNWQEPGGRS